jgi:hypothetical protein
MDLSDDDLPRIAAVDRREIDQPILVDTHVSSARQLDWWVAERLEWW